MANSSKGAGNFLGPLFIVAVVVVGALVLTFTISSEEVPDQATVIAEDDVDARPVGSGTLPEGEADENVEGVSDQLDEVDPAAPGEESVPPADLATEGGTDEEIEGETSADETTGGTADQPVIQDEPADQGNADANDISDAGGELGGTSGSDDSFVVDEESGDGQQGSDVTDADDGELPAGRDTQTDLSPEPGQDVVEDTDDGGAAFIPTPVGPGSEDDETAE